MLFYQQRKSQINSFTKYISENSRMIDYIGAGDIVSYWDSVLTYRGKNSYNPKQRILQRHTMSAEAERVQDELLFTQKESSQMKETGMLSSPTAYRNHFFQATIEWGHRSLTLQRLIHLFMDRSSCM